MPVHSTPPDSISADLPLHNGSFVYQDGMLNTQRIRIENLHLHLPADAQVQPSNTVKPRTWIDRIWLEVDRIQHVTVLLGALSMLALAIICCWPTGHNISWVTPLVVMLSLIGTAGFGYLYYDERAFK